MGAYSIISVIFFMAVSFAGTLFFGRREEYNFMEHGLPWIILVLSTSIKLTITGFEAALEGAGRVSKVAKKRAISNLIYAASIWLFVLYEFKLMAISLGSLISVIFLSIYYLINYKSFIAQQLSLYYGKNGNKNAVSRRYEVWPYQWKIALSWISGYFLYQLFTPVVFSILGPAEAGKLGIALSTVGALSSVVSSWTISKAAQVATIYSSNLTSDVRSTFYKMLISSISAAIILCISAGTQFQIVHTNFPEMKDKLPDMSVLIILFTGVILNQYVAVTAIFARATKREPFLIPSIMWS